MASQNETKCFKCVKSCLEEMHGELVCTSCGSVINRITIASGAPYDGTSSKFLSSENVAFSLKVRNYVPFSCLNKKKRDSQGKMACLGILNSLGDKCNMSEDMRMRCKLLLDKIFGVYRGKGSDFKTLLAASCVYYVLKEQKKCPSLNEFCKSLGQRPQVFLSVYHQMCKKLGVKSFNSSMEEQVENILSILPHGTPEEKQKRREIITKTIEIMHVAEQSWKSNSHSKSSCVIACAYFAWRLSDLSNENSSFDHFYYFHNFDVSKMKVEERVRDLYKLFIKLGDHIPHVDKEFLTRKFIIFFLKDILQYSEYLLSCLQTAEAKKEELEQSSPCPVKSEEHIDSFIPDEKLITEAEWKLYIRTKEEVSRIENLQKEKADEFSESEIS